MAEDNNGLGCSWAILLPIEILKIIWLFNNPPSSSFWYKYAYWSLIVIGAMIGIVIVKDIIEWIIYRKKKTNDGQ